MLAKRGAISHPAGTYPCDPLIDPNFTCQSANRLYSYFDGSDIAHPNKNSYIAQHTKLKSATAYYLLLIYFASGCKPLTIWFSDLLAHTFFEQEHFTTVHHQQGKNHVHYQIAKTANEDGPEKGAPPVKVIDEIYLPVQYHFPLYSRVVGINYNRFRSIFLPFIALSIQLPPPKV